MIKITTEKEIEIIQNIFDEFEKYENQYGISMPIQAYVRFKERWIPGHGKL